MLARIKRSTRAVNGSRRVRINFGVDSHVEQTHKNECNINNLIAKHLKTGLFPQRAGTPTYGDFTGALDFQTAQNRIKRAEKQFMELPSDIRGMFHNEPAELLEFVTDADNEAEAIELGLLPPLPAEYNIPVTEPPEAPVEPEPEPEPAPTEGS